jgi:hypothetical protein
MISFSNVSCLNIWKLLWVIFTYLTIFQILKNESPFPLKKREKEEGEKKAFMAIKTKYLDLVAIGQCGNIWSPLDGCGVISIFAPFHC